MGTVLQQLSLYVMLELYERAEARKDSGGDRNYVENSCISLHLVQGEVRMFINVHLVCKQITSHSNSVLLHRKASGAVLYKGLYRKINYIY